MGTCAARVSLEGLRTEAYADRSRESEAKLGVPLFVGDLAERAPEPRPSAHFVLEVCQVHRDRPGPPTEENRERRGRNSEAPAASSEETPRGAKSWESLAASNRVDRALGPLGDS